jgi:hypothetical protein
MGYESVTEWHRRGPRLSLEGVIQRLPPPVRVMRIAI